jgi:hypothetical protein
LEVYRQLLAEAGFRVVQVHSLPDEIYTVIEAAPT